MALQKQLDIELKVKQGAENMIQMYSNGSSKVSTVNYKYKAIQSVLMICRFHMCEFTYLIKFVTSASVLGAPSQSFVNMHRGMKTVIL